ncbi:helix-turn-helix transcriptional regulator [Arcobacter sp. YIC-80]|uniref:helix-turn-helix transcriptional regulator n=1 Tax=Arcobacter sp. YIC-80 TaxID=3376683 RepID=UPI00384EA5CB
MSQEKIRDKMNKDFENLPKKNSEKNSDTVLRRLMLILQKLSDNELPTRKDLEKEFNVTAKTIQRDIYQRLSYFPIEKTSLGQYKFIEGFTLNKTTLKEDEMLFVYLSLSQIKDINENFEKITYDIFSKLLTPRYSSPYYIKPNSFQEIDMDSSLLNRLEKAIELNNMVELKLQNRVFIIEPYKVVSFDGIWYLFGKDTKDEKIRTVFIHEIKELYIQKCKYKLDKPIDEILDNVHSAWFEDGNTMEVKVKVLPKAAFNFKLKKLLPSQEILKEYDDKSLLVKFTVSTQEDIDNIIKAWLPDIQIIEPQSYKEKFIKELQQYLKAYEA